MARIDNRTFKLFAERYPDHVYPEDRAAPSEFQLLMRIADRQAEELARIKQAANRLAAILPPAKTRKETRRA